MASGSASGGTGVSRPGSIYVWTLFVRFFHWMVAALFLVAYLSRGRPFWLHKYVGLSIFTLVCLRIVAGFLGSAYSRWSDFMYAPSVTWNYLLSLLALRPKKRYIGHSPAGGAMVLALVVCLFVTSGIGLSAFSLHRLFPEGGKAARVASPSPTPTSGATVEVGTERLDSARLPLRKGEEVVGGDRKKKPIWKVFHNFFAQLTMALAVLHVLGVALASFAHRENLVKSMVTGWKRRS